MPSTLTPGLLADALEAAVTVLRGGSAPAALVPVVTTPPGGDDAVSRARALHPLLGPRQAEILSLLEDAGAQGTNTGVISREMGYEQPNVYLTLRGLITMGFVTKDESTHPHRYRLSETLMG